MNLFVWLIISFAFSPSSSFILLVVSFRISAVDMDLLPKRVFRLIRPFVIRHNVLKWHLSKTERNTSKEPTVATQAEI